MAGVRGNITGKRPAGMPEQRPPFMRVLKRSGLMFWSMAPLLVGIMGLVGLLETLVTPEMLATLFRGRPVADTLVGTLAGAAATGNPVVSYLLGGELLQQGISLYAVTAFILSWVTLGVIQLPMEAEMFGARFMVLRNLLALGGTVLIAVLTGLTMQVLS